MEIIKPKGKVHLDFNSPARKKKRRSSLFDRRSFAAGSPNLFENLPLESVENEGVKLSENTHPNFHFKIEGNKEVDEYLQKLKKEKQLWIEYQKSLQSKYSTLKKTKESEEFDLNKYLNYLPKEDRDYLEMLDKQVSEYNHICKTELPDIEERLFLMSIEFEKQVKTSKLIVDDFKILKKKLEDLIFEKYFDNENWDSDVDKIDDSTYEACEDEDVLYIAGV